MIPENRLSTAPVYAPFYAPDDIDPPDDLWDVELGGVALSDPSEGLRVKVWMLRAEGATGKVYLSAPDVLETLVFTAPGVQEVSLSFDQNMRPFIAFVQNGQAKFRWYDSLLGANRITDLDPLDRNPRCTLDDKRDLQTASGNNDIILAYTRENALYFRAQRERYETEHLLKTGVNGRLLRVGMNTGKRLQFMFEETGGA
jgi:hypothetical protein